LRAGIVEKQILEMAKSSTLLYNNVCKLYKNKKIQKKQKKKRKTLDNRGVRCYNTRPQTQRP